MRKTTRSPIKDDACARCGNSKQHTTCPAFGDVSCDNCGKKNHYARVCFGKSKHNFANRNPKHRPGHNRYRSASQNIRDKRDYHDDKRETSQTRRTRHTGNTHSDDSSSDEYFLNHLKTHHTSKDNADKWKTCTIQINEISIVVEPDSGSDTNIMNESQFANLQKQAPELKIKATKIKLKALKEELPVIGEVDVEMSNEMRTVPTMLLIDVTGSLKSPNKTIKTVNKQNTTELDYILDKYQQRFTGIGKAMRDGKEIQITVPMKDDATPIAQKPRRVPETSKTSRFRRE